MARQRVGAEALLPTAGVGAWEPACHAGAGRPATASSSLGGRATAQAGVPVDLAVATVSGAELRPAALPDSELLHPASQRARVHLEHDRSSGGRIHIPPAGPADTPNVLAHHIVKAGERHWSHLPVLDDHLSQLSPPAPEHREVEIAQVLAPTEQTLLTGPGIGLDLVADFLQD